MPRVIIFVSRLIFNRYDDAAFNILLVAPTKAKNNAWAIMRSSTIGWKWRASVSSRVAKYTIRNVDTSCDVWSNWRITTILMTRKKERGREFPSDSVVDPSRRWATNERQDAAGTGRNESGIRKQFQKRRKHLYRHRALRWFMHAHNT